MNISLRSAIYKFLSEQLICHFLLNLRSARTNQKQLFKSSKSTPTFSSVSLQHEYQVIPSAEFSQTRTSVGRYILLFPNLFIIIHIFLLSSVYRTTVCLQTDVRVYTADAYSTHTHTRALASADFIQMVI